MDAPPFVLAPPQVIPVVWVDGHFGSIDDVALLGTTSGILMPITRAQQPSATVSFGMFSTS